jgi:hypothetical protein
VGAHNPKDREHTARIASYESWAQTPDRTARTAAGRQAFLDRFEKLVDPDGTMNPDERTQRADAARKAHFARMAYRSAKSRRSDAQRRREAATLNTWWQEVGVQPVTVERVWQLGYFTEDEFLRIAPALVRRGILVEDGDTYRMPHSPEGW